MRTARPADPYTELPEILPVPTGAKAMETTSERKCKLAPAQSTVDEISDDASYFWVWIDGQSGILIFHGDGPVDQKQLG